MIRQASSILQLAKQLDVLAELGPEDESDIEIFREASALVQHHDAVTWVRIDHFVRKSWNVAGVRQRRMWPEIMRNNLLGE